LTEEIKTIKEVSEHRIKEKGSLFIALAFPVDSKERAEEILHNLRRKYFDATHHCYAYKLKGDEIKYSDDGEPSGTAGIRILKGIEHFDLSEVVVIVIRYYGGTKLGVGPLGKAYYEAAHDCLEKAEKAEKHAYRFIKIEYPEEFTSQVYHLLGQSEVRIKESGFSERPFILLHIKAGIVEVFTEQLKNQTKGGGNVEIMGEIEYLAR